MSDGYFHKGDGFVNRNAVLLFVETEVKRVLYLFDNFLFFTTARRVAVEYFEVSSGRPQNFVAGVTFGEKLRVLMNVCYSKDCVFHVGSF